MERPLGFFDSLLRQLPVLVARIAVGGGGNDVGEALLVERDHERAMHVERAEATARLRQAAPLGHRLAHYPA
jgi:hypothetical protein